jgi:hypothetical protein
MVASWFKGFWRLGMGDGMAIEELSEEVWSSVGARQIQEAYLDAQAQFVLACDASFAEQFPSHQPHSDRGLHGALSRLSKRLAELTESYFRIFAKEIDAIGQEDLAAGADDNLVRKWRRAVMDRYAPELWHDACELWINWHDLIWNRMGGRKGPMVTDSPEHLILRSHKQRMLETLARIAGSDSISKHVVAEMRAVGQATRAPWEARPATVGTARAAGVRNDGHVGEPNKRGRPVAIPDDLKQKALMAQGGKARAQILYGTRHPSAKQMNNVASILRHYEKKHPLK